MNLNEMLVFTKVVQAGSFRAAARELDMPKSTVSRRVSELEDRLGARLLQRTTRKLSLTDVGSAYFRRCARIVAEVEEADLEVMQTQSQPRGLLRVSVPLTARFLAPTVTEYLRRYPGTRIEMVCTDRVVDLIEDGFDAAIRVGRLTESTLVSRTIGRGATLVVASPSYLEGRPIPTAPADLKSHDCLVFGAGQARSRWTLQSGRRTVEVTVPARLAVNDFDVLMDAALGGLGIAMLPAQACSETIRAGRLHHLLEGWQSPARPMQVVYPSTRQLSPKVRAFLDLLVEMAPPWELNSTPGSDHLSE